MATKAQIFTACPELAEWANRRNAQNLCVFCVLRGEKERSISYNKIMQNKPNLLNAQINVTLFITMDYKNVCRLGRRKNKPNSNPIPVRQLVHRPVHRSLGEDGSSGEGESTVTNFTYKQQMHPIEGPALDSTGQILRDLTIKQRSN